MSDIAKLVRTTAQLQQAGCVAADEEAVELLAAAQGSDERLAGLVARRVEGEPLAWLVGSVEFCGVTVKVHSGVYVPRWQSEQLALGAVERLPDHGVAVDLCTGSGAVALVLADRRPGATVFATDVDPRAVACARDNGVHVVEGDMADGLSDRWRGQVDVVTAVVPYVPTGELRHLPPDTLRYEPLGALDGGTDGTRFLLQAAAAAAQLLRTGGSILLELGGDEADLVAPTLTALGFGRSEQLIDDEGDVRGIVSRR